MNRSVGITYAITGAVTAAAMLVVTAATFGLGGEAAPGRAEGVAGSVPESIATASAIVPAGMLKPNEQIVSAAVVQTDTGPIHYVTVEPAPAAAGARSHDDDDDDDDDDEHEERREREHEDREHEDREHSSRTRRESR